MKVYNIFVEGVADKRFIEQLIQHVFGVPAVEGNVISTGGYANMMAHGKENTFINLMRRTSDDDGVNLVIFDADKDFEGRKDEILSWKERCNVDFDLFLFPDNGGCGAIEDLLERIINPDNRAVMDSWDNYETSIRGIQLSWRQGRPLTIPAKKTKIYAYLEVLLGASNSEKEKIKERNRDYTNKNHWNLDSDNLRGLVDFLKSNLS